MSSWRCFYCGRELDPHGPDAYQRVNAWQRPGRGISGRSGSSLVLRETAEVFACSVCVSSRLAGVHTGQTSLLDEDAVR